MVTTFLYSAGMTNAPSSGAGTSSRRDRAQTAATFRDAVPAVVVLVLLEGLLATVDLHAGDHPWHLAVALLPVLPALWLGWAQVRSLRRADEYQRTLQLEAMAVGFAVAMAVALVGGLVDTADVGSSTQFLQITFIAGIVSWAGTLAMKLR
jgi:hypothetical protein